MQNKEDLRDQQIKKNPSRRNADEMLKKRPRIFYTLLKKAYYTFKKLNHPQVFLVYPPHPQENYSVSLKTSSLSYRTSTVNNLIYMCSP